MGIRAMLDNYSVLRDYLCFSELL